MPGVRIHQSSDQASAEAAAGRLRADGIPAEIVRADVGFAPYGGAGLSSAYDVLVPEHLSRKARRSLGIVEREDAVDRRRRYAVIVLTVLIGAALVVFALGVLQRIG
jgi:hypothetical protein